MYIPIILGTARKNRRSEKVAKFLIKKVLERGIKTEIIDVRDFIIGATDNTKESDQAKILSEKISNADGLIIVVPEYNHGYPGELKMMLDLLYEEYARKPVAFCGVSIGGFGGVRAVEQLKLITIKLGMVPIRFSIYFSNVENLFDEEENIKDPSYKTRIEEMLNELFWYARVLKKGREES